MSIEAKKALISNRYREKFGLSHAEMEVEPMTEILMNMQIWKFDEEKAKAEQRRAELKSKGSGG